MPSPYSKITNDKFDLAWDIYEVPSESGYLHMLGTSVKLLSEEDNVLLDWHTGVGEEVSIGYLFLIIKVSNNTTVHATRSLDTVKLGFSDYY
ncbi:hypothetical protein FQA39_LY10471 [Lamprigera yunnana]|nr:hypothetical protein FQA39_LY10471 [Lamprigera yunnana]